MKKNLKKVISAVIALALSASTFASVSFAKSFTDVASTASYAEAVDVLSSLGIINGYEDGTFGPDKTIKRSEAAKVIVAMVNKLEAAEGRMGTTQFTDVAADHWASGFINVGVTEGFINGMGGGIFKPDGEVTYNQIVKMIVSCLGYEEYAQFYGGYPTGYVSIADSEGITKGCSMNGDSAATRGVVAQLVYNALKTPVIQNKGMTYSASAGGFVPNIEKQDGEESTYYKTLLTEKFDAYMVEGKVTKTPKTESSYSNEVDFTIEKTETYNHDDIKKGNTLVKIDAGETVAAEYINTYSIAIVQENDDEEWTLISFIPSGKNKTVTLDLGLFDEDEYQDNLDKVYGTESAAGYTDASTIINKAQLKFFASEDATRSTKYEISENAKLYANGILVNDQDTANTVDKLTKADIEKYILNNTVGTIELVDAYAAGSSADGVYEYIYVDYYVTAKVDSVTSKKITFSDKDYKLTRSTLTLDTEDNEDLEYHIFYNDEEVAITDIQKDDILSIAFDPNTTVDKANYFEIYVARDVQTGKVNGKDTEDEVVTIGGEDYSFVDKSATKNYESMAAGLTMGSEYTLYLDVFGRIFSYDIEASAAKLAIIDRYYQNNAGDYVGIFYFTDGTSKTLEVDNSKTNLAPESIMEYIYYADDSGKHTSDNYNKTPIENRVVEYKISSTTNKVTSLTFKNPISSSATFVSYTLAAADEFKARTNAVGAIKMNDATNIIDATEYYDNWSHTDSNSKRDKNPSYSDLVKGSLSSTFADGIEYVAYGFGDKNTDGTYPLVIVLDGQGAYTEDTKFAVVNKALTTKTNDAGDEGYGIEMYYEGALTTMFVTDDATVDGVAITDSNYTDKLSKGDVVVFQENSKGEIDQIDIIFTGALASTHDATVTASLITDFSKFVTKPKEAKYWTLAWDDEEKSDWTTSLVYGVVTDKKEGYFQLGKVATGDVVTGKDADTDADIKYAGLYTCLDTEVKKDGKKNASLTNNGGVLDIGLTDATKVYVYDYSQSRKDNMLYEGTKSDIVATSIPDSQIITGTNGYEYIPWDMTVDGVKVSAQNDVTFAFAKVVDGTATEVFVILAD